MVYIEADKPVPLPTPAAGLRLLSYEATPAATLHFLAALDNGGYFEACVSKFNPLRDMFGRTFTIGADGCVEPPEAPGIGLDIDEKVFAEFPAIDGPGYVVKF